MRLQFATAMLLLVVSVGLKAQQTKTVKAFNNSFSLSLPPDLRQLSAEEVSKLYPIAGPQRPSLVYMGAAKDLIMSLNLTDKKMSIQSLVAHKTELFGGMKRNPSLTWVGDEVKTINGKQYLVCTFTKTSPTGETNYNRLFFTSLGGNMLAGTLSIEGVATNEQKARVEAILASLKM